MRYLVLAALGVSIATGCARHGTEPSTTPPLTTLRSAPVSVQVGARSLTLQSTMMRDFELPLPPGGRGLVGSFAVAAADDEATRPQVELEAAWVLNGSEVWTPILQYHPLVDPVPNVILKYGFDGPKWPVGTEVQVIVRIRDTSGRAYLLRDASQKIEGAY